MVISSIWVHFLVVNGLICASFGYQGKNGRSTVGPRYYSRNTNSTTKLECSILGSHGYCLPLGKCPFLEKKALTINSVELLQVLAPYSIACDSIGRGYCCPSAGVGTKTTQFLKSYDTTSLKPIFYSNVGKETKPVTFITEKPMTSSLEPLLNVSEVTSSIIPREPEQKNKTKEQYLTTPFPFTYGEPKYSSQIKPSIKQISATVETPTDIDDPNRQLLPDSTCGIVVSEKIKGGNTAKEGKYPWMAYLLIYKVDPREGNQSCGGSLISSRYIVSAAHCLSKSPKLIREVVALLGTHNLQDNEDCMWPDKCGELQDINVESWKVHEMYDFAEQKKYDDIALLRLAWEAVMNDFVVPICLPRLDALNDTFDGERLLTAGWGLTEELPTSFVLNEVELPAVPLINCAPLYEHFLRLRDTQMCAGGENEKDTCEGDSGGPLMKFQPVGNDFRWMLVGIVSFGPNPCGLPFPSVYTRVTRYISWILDNMRE